MLTTRELFLNNLAQTSDSPLQLEVEKAEGVYLFDTKGKRYFDLISGISVSNIGHCNPVAVKAINDQVSKYMHLMVYGEFIQQPQVTLAKSLTDLLPNSLNNVYFVNSGSEAVEGAMKLAKRYTGRSEIISFKNAYHGSSQGALSLMGNEEFKRSFRPLLPSIMHIEFNNMSDLNLITTSTAAVFIEPVQGEAGIRVPAEGFLKSLREKCYETGTLLVFDEIQTGMGRTGQMFAFQKYGVLPDILLLAKALGGGMPLGAFISSKEIMSTLSYNPVLGHITTFGGHPVSCAASLSALSFLCESKIVEAVEQKGELFHSLLSKHQAVLEIRRSGLLIAVELGAFDRVLAFIKSALDEGVITDWFLFCNTAVRIAPPLTITNDQIREVCASIIRVLDRL